MAKSMENKNKIEYRQLSQLVNNIDVSKFTTYKIAIVSNVNLEPYLGLFLVKDFSENELFPSVEYYQIGTFLNCVTSEKIIADVIVVLIDFEVFYTNLLNDLYSDDGKNDTIYKQVTSYCLYIYDRIIEKSYGQILWFGFEDYCFNICEIEGSVSVGQGLIDKINSCLINHIQENNVYIDLKRIIAYEGIAVAYDTKGKYRWNAPYSSNLIARISQEIHKQYLVGNEITAKCIVLDCDNVLWGGILSEVGIENIVLGANGLGREYQDFQKFMLSLFYHGVILTVCSKNDRADVMKVFREHDEMILKEEYISCFEVSWNNKVEGVRHISKILNIGLESMVFVDDSYFEIELMKSELPEVHSIRYDRDDIYKKLSCFSARHSKLTMKTIIERNSTYRSNKKRMDMKRKCKDYNSYLDSLEMKVSIRRATPIEYNRIAELSKRTNKCTNGKRYALSELKRKADVLSFELYFVSVSDKFSDLGIVGAMAIQNDVLELFCLSCRAMGRSIEDKMMKFIGKKKVSSAFFAPTGKNEEIFKMLARFFKIKEGKSGLNKKM